MVLGWLCCLVFRVAACCSLGSLVFWICVFVLCVYLAVTCWCVYGACNLCLSCDLVLLCVAGFWVFLAGCWWVLVAVLCCCFDDVLVCIGWIACLCWLLMILVGLAIVLLW